jgi:hypothetical protein
MLLMVMFAARSGPDRIFAGPLHDPSVRPVDPSYTFAPPPDRTNQVHYDDVHRNPFFLALGWVIPLLALVCVLWLLYRGVRRLLRYLSERDRRSREQGLERVDFDVLDDPEPLLEEMRLDADVQFELLLGGHPRNAIVACWDRFEEQAEHVNASRRDWETSSEFTIRLLDAVSADAEAVSRLAELYHEARFSEHEIDEGRRRAAVEALRRIHASLGIGAGAR